VGGADFWDIQRSELKDVVFGWGGKTFRIQEATTKAGVIIVTSAILAEKYLKT
jgi:hypothetical protein